MYVKHDVPNLHIYTALTLDLVFSRLRRMVYAQWVNLLKIQLGVTLSSVE
jgi:hypothetical protein